MNYIDKIKNEIDLCFNESTIEFIEIKDDKIVLLLSCMINNTNKNNGNIFRLEFESYGRIAISYKKGSWEDKNSEVEIIKQNELKPKFDNLELEPMYGWEFVNIENKHFIKWSNKLSFDKINDTKWKEMNTLDIFGEQFKNKTLTIDTKIWFYDFKVFDIDNKEITKDKFIEYGRESWEQVFKN